MMISLRCFFGFHSYDGFLCTSCDLGWRECSRCGSLKRAVDEANYYNHVEECQK